MKRLTFAIAASAILIGACSADTKAVWGVWNIGERGDARYNAEMSLGHYLRTGRFLKIEPNRKGKQEIQFEGGHYTIRSVKEEKDVSYFTLEYDTSIKSKNGKWKDITITGVVAMHFLTKDEAWFEVVYSDKNTDSRFPKRDFPGESVEYWRAQKIDHPVQEDSGD